MRALPDGVIRIPDVSRLPVGARDDRDTFAGWGMRSAVVVGLPTWPNPTLLALGSATVRWPRRRLATDVVRTMGDLIGNALGRVRAEHLAQQHGAELVHVARVTTLGELAASLAHELNQPLGAILASAEAGSLFLDADPPNVERVRDIVRRIAAEDSRAHQIIARMRALFRRAAVERVPLYPDELVAETIHLVQHEAATRRVTLRVDVAPGLPPVRGDRVQLQQVLLNLLLNAFDALPSDNGPPAGGVLLTAQRSDATHIELAVRDAGRGIAAEDMPRLFEPFFTTKPRGLGMGLPICRSIVEMHGGTIFCRSNPDRGATIGFTLPCVTDSTLDLGRLSSAHRIP